jgi:hypothetical protein
MGAGRVILPAIATLRRIQRVAVDPSVLEKVCMGPRENFPRPAMSVLLFECSHEKLSSRHLGGQGTCAGPIVSAMVAPREPSGFGFPIVESMAV